MAKINGLCVVIAALVFGIFVVHATPIAQRQLGASQCTWGPSFWCGNLTNAKMCHAVRHCIQTVWEMQNVPEDNDSICKICKDMVAKARDQLRSNETMEELKEVFEGSCDLIPIKLVKKECYKLADDFVPELVEALSSQMNPDQVCSVAGLCNNAKIDELLQKYYSAALDGTLVEEESTEVQAKVEPPTTANTPNKKRNLLTCGSCNNLGTFIAAKFDATNRDDMLESILHLCGEMSSFSDACSSIVLTYFNDIYSHLKQNLNAAGICHLSGVCASNYHRHPEDEKVEKETTDLAMLEGDDIPCELCEQLVNHLRDLLVANTTEVEFKQVLEGLCKQTKNFKEECLSIVDQYYDVIYQSLVKNLDANGACFMIGVCPKGKTSMLGGEIRPLLPAAQPAEVHVTIRKKLGANEPKFTQEDLKSMAIPIDHLMGAANPGLLVEGGELCTLCEYMLHFIQEALATPATEEEIKHTVSEICDKMPKGVKGQCHNFIDMYGDAVIALLIQGLNPREVCPKMQMCPKNFDNRDDMEVIAVNPIRSDESDKPTCPLCLFAVEQAQMEIKDNKSKQHIKSVLDHLCNRLPAKLKAECVDFIETYSNELIDKLISNFKPQEICVSLKLCDSTNSYLEDMGISMEDFDSREDKSSENEIDSNEMPIEIEFQQHVAPNCWLCEEVIKNAEKRINKRTTKDDIKRALHRSCDKLKRKNIQGECNKYVDRYGDKIATLILKEMEPKMICRELGFCLWSELEDLDMDEALKYDVIAAPQEQLKLVPYNRLTGIDDMVVKEPPTCVLCEFVMTKLEADLKNKTTQDEIKHAIENVCHHMPKTVSQSCEKFVEQYASAIIALIGSVPPKEICTRMQLCLSSLDAVVTDEVVECGVCHGAASALLPYFKKQENHENILTQDLVAVACETLPAKYYTICSEMVAIYGQSILHLSEQSNMNEPMICAEIGKCFDNEKSSLAFARITA